VLSVSDEGAGLTTEEKQQIGNRSFRGARHINRVPGAGLGLWIADTFTVANGSTLDAHSGRAGARHHGLDPPARRRRRRRPHGSDGVTRIGVLTPECAPSRAGRRAGCRRA
jgi:K+-sensing histidine kinase KdpD